MAQSEPRLVQIRVDFTLSFEEFLASRDLPKDPGGYVEPPPHWVLVWCLLLVVNLYWATGEGTSALIILVVIVSIVELYFLGPRKYLLGRVASREFAGLRSDYERFHAFRRTFKADERGWSYSDAQMDASHPWGELSALERRQETIALWSLGVRYVLPKSAFKSEELNLLMMWAYLALPRKVHVESPPDTIH